MELDSNIKIGMGMIFLLFLILKLTHVIDWSWWWITFPIWIIPALILLFIILIRIKWII